MAAGGKMYRVKKKEKTGTLVAAFLLTALLAGCGQAPRDASGVKDIPEGIPMTQFSHGEEDLEGDSEGVLKDNASEGGHEGIQKSNTSEGEPEGVQGGNALNPAESPSPSPTPYVEPFVDKLTQEGIGWGLSFGNSGEQPQGNASREELAQYNAYFMDDDSEKVIYLTFDCGYENGNTEPILDALKAHDAPATFFVVGHFLETAPELVKRMAAEGHAVGNHTYHHYDVDTLDEAAFQEEMKAVEELFQEVTGVQLSPYYRPPEGKCGITNLKRAQSLGYNTIFWSLAYVDWDVDNQPSHDTAIDKLTGRIHPGAIVLLHNTSRTNGEILDELLTKWEEMGYTFKPLSYLMQGSDT